MMQHADEILKFWFGRVETTIIPTERRARIWFGEDIETDSLIRKYFHEELELATVGSFKDWEETPRGQLALILLLDQFSRHVYRNEMKAFSQDRYALSVCLKGIENEADHSLSLIERVFYYFPLLHAEDIECQERSVQAYRILSELAFAETRVVYDSFLKFANHHYGIIQRFGRFPQRNTILGRQSTEEEKIYLKEIEPGME